MTRLERRELAKDKNAFKELMKVMRHFFPQLLNKFKKVQDWRHQSYITYGSDEIILVVLLGYMLALSSMRNMTESFNKEECIKNIKKILKCFKNIEIPHHDTINDFLEKLDLEELEKVRTYMIKRMISMRSFESFKLLKHHWLVIVDATGLYSFKERHCEHCLTRKHTNKDTGEEWKTYYHNVLEAKLVFEDIVISIETEFIENEKEDVEKQDCELKAFDRLAKKLKKRFKRLSLCFLGDSLYACDRFFKICKEYNWEFIVRFKEGRIKSVAAEFESIRRIEEKDIQDSKCDEKEKLFWVNEIVYNNHRISLLEMDIEESGVKKKFVWITSQAITAKNVKEIAATGRKRWKIENEGFNEQKQIVYSLEHTYSRNYNAMKNHYLIFQMAHAIRQLFEKGIKYLKVLKTSLNNISSDLLESLRNKLLATEDIIDIEKRTQIRFY